MPALHRKQTIAARRFDPKWALKWNTLLQGFALTSGSSVSLAKVPKGKHAMADKTGACLCGAVAFEITGPLRPVIACHCHQCRKQTGTYMSSTAVKDEQFKPTETRGLKWYRSSDTGR